MSWAGTLYIHFWRFLPPDRILPRAKFTMGLSLAFSYIGSVTAWHSSSGRQPNFGALSRGRHLYLAGWPSHWASSTSLVYDCYNPLPCINENENSIVKHILWLVSYYKKKITSTQPDIFTFDVSVSTRDLHQKMLVQFFSGSVSIVARTGRTEQASSDEGLW